MEEGCEWLNEALHSLLNSSDPKQRIQVNEKLVKFRDEPESFTVCLQSIYSPHSTVRVFASQSICYVCRKGSPDVINDANNRSSMLKVLNDVREDATLFGNISIAFLCFLRSDVCRAGKFLDDIISIVQNVKIGILVAHVLSFIPELCQRRDVAMTKAKRNELPKEIGQKQMMMFQFCLELLSKVSDVNDQCIILHCLTEWVNFRLLSAKVWYQPSGQSLLATCFTQLPNSTPPVKDHMERFLTAVVSNLVMADASKDFVVFISNGVLSLMKHAPNDAFDVVLAFCNSNVQLVKSSQEPPFTLFVEYLVEATRSEDVKKVQDCLDWWPAYCKNLDSEHVECVLRVIAESAFYRESLKTEDARYEFSLFRRNIRDTFRMILGKRHEHVGENTVKFLLQNIDQTANWRHMEMGLHFLSVLIKNLNPNHVTHIIPRMLYNTMLIRHRACSRLAVVTLDQVAKHVPQEVLGKDTMDSIISFACQNSEVIEDDNEFPFRIKEDHVAPIFFMKASKHWNLTGWLEQIFETYRGRVAILFSEKKSTMSKRSLLVFTRALCTIVRSLRGGAHQQALHSTLRHTWQRVTFALDEALRIRNDGAVPSAEVRQLCSFALSETNHITNVAADWSSPDVVAYFQKFFEEQWYVLEALMKFAQDDDDVIEQVCTILEKPVAYLEKLRTQVLSLSVETLGESLRHRPSAPWIRLFGECIVHTQNYQLFGSLATTHRENLLFKTEDTLKAWYKVMTRLLKTDPNFFCTVDNDHKPIFAVVLDSTFTLMQSTICSGFSFQACREMLKFFHAYLALLKNNQAANLHQDRYPIQCIQSLLLALNGGFPSYLLEDLIVVYRTFFTEFPDKFEFWISQALEGDIPKPSTKPEVKKTYLKNILSEKSKKQAKYFKKVTKGFCGGKKKQNR